MIKLNKFNLQILLIIPSIISLIFYTHLFISSPPMIDTAPLINASFLINKGFQIYTDFESAHPPLASYFLFLLSKVFEFSPIKIVYYKITYFLLILISIFLITCFTKNIFEKNKIKIDFSIIFLLIFLLTLNLFIPTLGNGLMRGEVLAFFSSSILLFLIFKINKQNIFFLSIFAGLLIFFILFSSPRFFSTLLIILFFFIFFVNLNLIEKLKTIIISLSSLIIILLIFFNSLINFNDFLINVVDFNFHPREHNFVEMIVKRIERLNYLGISPFGHFLTLKYTISIFIICLLFYYFIKKKFSYKTSIFELVPILILFIDFYFLAKNGDGAQQSFSSFSMILILSIIFYFSKFYEQKNYLNFNNNLSLKFNKIFSILLILIFCITSTAYYKKMLWFNNMDSFNKLKLTAEIGNRKINKDELKNFHNGLISNLGSWYYHTKLLCNAISDYTVSMDWEYAPGCHISPSHYRSQYRFYAHHKKIIKKHGELNFINDLQKKPVIIDNAVYARFNTKTKFSNYSKNDLFVVDKILKDDYIKLEWGFVLKNFFNNL